MSLPLHLIDPSDGHNKQCVTGIIKKPEISDVCLGGRLGFILR